MSALGRFAVVLALGCSTKHSVTEAECRAMVAHYTELALRESLVDASAERIVGEQARVAAAAAQEGALTHCAEEVDRATWTCAMASPTADAFEACF